MNGSMEAGYIRLKLIIWETISMEVGAISRKTQNDRKQDGEHQYLRLKEEPGSLRNLIKEVEELNL